MVATVRLDSSLEDTLTTLSTVLKKRKSDVIREAISFYSENIINNKKSKLLEAIKKTKDIDKKEFMDFESVIDDGI